MDATTTATTTNAKPATAQALQQPAGAAAAAPAQPRTYPTPRTRIYYNPELSEFSLGEDHPMVPHRLHLTHRLAELWGLYDDPAVQIIQDYAPATPDQLRRFHTDEYVAFLEYLDTLDLANMSVDEQQELLGDDLALFGLSVCRPPAQEDTDEEAAALVTGSGAGPGPGSAAAAKAEPAQQRQQQQPQKQRAKSEPQGQGQRSGSVAPKQEGKGEMRPPTAAGALATTGAGGGGGGSGGGGGGGGAAAQNEQYVAPQLFALALQLVCKLAPVGDQQLSPAQQAKLLQYLRQQQQQFLPRNQLTGQPVRGPAGGGAGAGGGGGGGGSSRPPVAMVRPGQTTAPGKQPQGGGGGGGGGSKKRKADGKSGGGKKKSKKGKKRRSYSDDDDEEEEVSEDENDAPPAEAPAAQPAAAGGSTRESARPSRQAATAVAALTNAVRRTEAEASDDEGSEEEEEDDDDDEGGDCPIFPGLLRYVGLQAAGSILAARDLAAGLCDVAVHWGGGMHHGMPYRAFGFCYVNDLVLAILELMAGCGRVLYIDIDVHHGDGVETAFKRSEKVMSISLHKWDDGRMQAANDTLDYGKPQRPVFFPGTGKKNDLGEGGGKYYTVNVPLQDDITDDSYFTVYRAVVKTAFERFKPQAVVLQCGCDSVAGDKLGRFNLSIRGHSRCVELVRDLCRSGGWEGGAPPRGGSTQWRIPLLVTGGGGYTPPLVARCWALETAVLLGRELGEGMPPSVAAAPDLADLGPSYFKDTDLSRPPKVPFSMCLDTILMPGRHKQMDSDYSLSRLAAYLTSNIQRINIRDAPPPAAAAAAPAAPEAGEEDAAAGEAGGNGAEAKDGAKDGAPAAAPPPPAASKSSKARKSAASGPGVADPLKHLTAPSGYPDAEDYIQEQKERVAAGAAWAAKMPPPPVPKGRKGAAGAAGGAGGAQGANRPGGGGGGAGAGKSSAAATGGKAAGAALIAAMGAGVGLKPGGAAAEAPAGPSDGGGKGAGQHAQMPFVPGLPTILPYQPKGTAAAGTQPSAAGK